MEASFTNKIKSMAVMVEKFVEHNFVEKEQRDENLKKLAAAFDTFVKDNPLRQGFVRTEGVTALGPVGVKVKKLDNFKGELPKYQSSLASGLDVRAQLTGEVCLKPGQRTLIPTGLAFSIPKGYEIQARPRSGWAIRDGISLLNTPGTIDADYRGEVKIIVVNLGENEVVIKDQDRVAQLVLCPVLQAEFQEVMDLDETTRGEGGFGSTGRA